MDLQAIRKLGWIGLLVPVLIAVIWFGLGLNDPGWSASGATVLSYYDRHYNAELATQYLSVAMLVVLLVYATVLWRALRLMTGQHVLPAVVFAGSIIFFAGSAVNGYASFALLEGSRSHMPTSAAEAFNALSNADPVAFQVGALLITAATGLTILLLIRKTAGRRSLAWLGWLSLVVAAANALTPIGLLAFALWVPLTGFVLGRRATSFIAAVPPAVRSDLLV